MCQVSYLAESEISVNILFKEKAALEHKYSYTHAWFFQSMIIFV